MAASGLPGLPFLECMPFIFLYFLTLSLMSNTRDSNSYVFHPMVVGVKILPAVVHIVRAELVVVLDIPDKQS